MIEENKSVGLLLVISGPSGVGKTTITRSVERELGGVFSVSMTTRPKTAADTEGKDYYFVDLQRFDKAREAGELLEWAQVFGHCYGTPRQQVQQSLAAGKLVLLEIDVEGAVQVKKCMPQSYAIFVLPPSEESLLQRLRGRKREDEEMIQHRFHKAKQEIVRARHSGVYNTFIVNDDLETAVHEAVERVRTELASRCGG